MFDIVIIGAGVTGCILARELSRYKLNILLLDAENDVGNVTSSANSAIIHSGYDPIPGTLKAKLNVLGCAKYEKLCDELDVSYSKCGTLTIMTDPSQRETIDSLIERSENNGVSVRFIPGAEVKRMEPNITSDCLGAIYAPSAGIVNPFELVTKAAENAVDNGVELRLNSKVVSINYINGYYTIKTHDASYKSSVVINAAGLYADEIAKMVEDVDWDIKPKKGEYYVLDHKILNFVTHPLFPLPSTKGKGILVAPTTSGNYYLGPTSEYVYDKSDYSTDKLTLDKVLEGAKKLVPNIPMTEVIRVFAGLRAESSRHDFIIEPLPHFNTFINVAGIESPGLASSPAIADYVITNFISKLFSLTPNASFNPCIKKHKIMKNLSLEEQNDLIKINPNYGTIVCQCEKVTLGEIEDILSRSVKPHSLKGLKRRLRTGFGKCQGGFCFPRLAKILSEKYNIPYNKILLDGIDSSIVVDVIKKVNDD